jgi:hypothetical protein
MKKVFALVILVASVAQANELEKAWNNFGKDNRAISGGKAVVAGYVAYASAKQVYSFYNYMFFVYGEHRGWFEVLTTGIDSSIKSEILLRNGILAGLSGYTAYLFSKQAWHDAKHALGRDKKKELT